MTKHEHAWQYVDQNEEHGGCWSRLIATYGNFICHCGARKKVILKKLEGYR